MFNKSDLNFSALLEKFESSKILVIGDLMLDHYIWGDAHRISPEAPVPVVNVIKDSYSAGGAANVALNLANLGVNTTLLGHFSKDDAGSKLCDILNEKNIEIINPIVSIASPTIIKTRVLVRNQQLCRIDREVAKEHYSVVENNNYAALLENMLSNFDAVIISDYAKGVVTQELVDFIMSYAAKRNDLLIAVDPKPSRKLNIKGAGLLTPNRVEALQLAGFNDVSNEDHLPIDKIAQRIFDLYDPKLLIITLGPQGMAICKEGTVQEILPTEAREVFDVSGAGDTVIATLTAALASGANPHLAARLANGAAGTVVAHMGTVPVVYAELEQWIKAQ